MTANVRPKPGEYVILRDVPEDLLKNLPGQDQKAIREAVGKRARLNNYEDDGRAELEVVDSNGTIHFLYVRPESIRSIE